MRDVPRPQHFSIGSEEDGGLGRRETNFARRFLKRKGERKTVKTHSIFADWVLIRELCLGGFIVGRNFPWPH